MRSRWSGYCRSILPFALGAAALLAPSVVLAGTTVVATSFWADIDDSTETMRASVASLRSGGYIPPTTPCSIDLGLLSPPNTCTITQEGVGTFGRVDMHIEYVDFDAGALPLGGSRTFNFNVFETGTVLSDTLSITFTGQSNIGFGNTSVDLHFLSDSLDDLLPPPLLDASSIAEISDVSVIFAQNGFSGAHVRFASDVEGVPEPATLALLGVALAGLGFSRRKQ